jgi:hypothetical protein
LSDNNDEYTEVRLETKFAAVFTSPSSAPPVNCGSSSGAEASAEPSEAEDFRRRRLGAHMLRSFSEEATAAALLAYKL